MGLGKNLFVLLQAKQKLVPAAPIINPVALRQPPCMPFKLIDAQKLRTKRLFLGDPTTQKRLKTYFNEQYKILEKLLTQLTLPYFFPNKILERKTFILIDHIFRIECTKDFLIKQPIPQLIIKKRPSDISGGLFILAPHVGLEA
jgi:hypothetical protein